VKYSENGQDKLVETFYKGLDQRNAILSFLLEDLRETADAECKLAKISMSDIERDSEMVIAILQAVHDYQVGTSPDLEYSFQYWFRRQLRGLTAKRAHVDIEDVVVIDESPDPLERLIIKEQVDMVKAFLRKHTDPVTADQFYRRYMDGQTFREIAQEDKVGERYLAIRLNVLFDRVQKYMVRITNA
jgi:hypothetical protein